MITQPDVLLIHAGAAAVEQPAAALVQAESSVCLAAA